MAANYPELERKRLPMRRRMWQMYIPLLLLLLLVLFSGIFVLKSSTKPGLIFASENKDAVPNHPPADANTQSEQEQKDPNDKKPPRPDHKHPAFSERVDERLRMVARHIQAEGIRDPNVLASLRTVPRHAFVLPGDLRRAYRNHPLSIGLGQTISQPYIVAYMTEALKLSPGYKVLEIGTGSGYQAAVCAEIAQEVYTVEILEELAESAKERLKKLGYRNVFVRAADGYFGWKEKGPFDVIIVTCVAGLVPPPLKEQLKPGGRMILPLGSPFGIQRLVLITKDDKDEIRSRSLLPVRFVPMLGRVTEAERPPRK